MVIKVYISGISGSKEVKKRQQRVLLILDSKNVKYEVIDIAEPGSEEAKDFMQNNSTSVGATISDPTPRHPLPPQIFNDEEYCGDYDQFDMANEIDEMEKFLKIEVPDPDVNLTSNAEIKLNNGEITPEETKAEENETKENEVEVPEEQEKIESEEKSNDAETKDAEETKENDDTQENAESKDEAEETKDTEEKSEDNEPEAAGDKAEKVEEKESSKNEDEKADEE